MRVLVIGSGAREHALAWKLSASPMVDRLYVAPGNGGTSQNATNLPIQANDIDGLIKAAQSHSIDLTVVGPEAPLAAGIVDRFRSCGLEIFGPSRQAATLEWSKAFANQLMKDHNIPSPEFKVINDYSQAVAFLEHHDGPLVVKADGLAAGKGVAVCEGRSEALAALDQCMRVRAFGAAGDTVVIEELLIGTEISVFAFCDGEHVSHLMAACDYKRVSDGDQGPNTGGMGSYSPPPVWTPELVDQVRERIILPVVSAMADRGTPYQGWLYAGLMLTAQGPRVLEFNCRLGDPEAQVVLPLIKTDLAEYLVACVEGRIDEADLSWAPGASVGIVMASEGYPGGYPRGRPIYGLDDIDPGVMVFHAGTKFESTPAEQRYVTDGGRVITVVACGEDLTQARDRVYDNIHRIRFQGAQFRKDIALMKQVSAA